MPEPQTSTFECDLAPEEWDLALQAIIDGGPAHLPGDVDDEFAVPSFDALPGIPLIRALAQSDPHSLSPAQRIEYLRATERVMSWVWALQSRALVAEAGSRSRIDEYELPDARVLSIEDASREEIAAATRWSSAWTDELIATARLLDGPLPATQAALESGAVSSRHAHAIASAAQRLTGYAAWLAGDDLVDPDDADVATFIDACAQLEGAVLPVATSRGVAATRRAGERALLRIDAEHTRRRAREARRERDVWISEEPDGMALLIARLGIEQAHACLTSVNARARAKDLPLASGTPDDASVGERRADAVLAMLIGAADQRPVIRAHVDVVIGLDTLLRINDEPGQMGRSDSSTSSPVSADIVRDLIAADPSCTLRRLVTDPISGHLLDRGRTSYAISESLRTFIVTRDGTCRFPGCGRPAGLADIDHAQPWDQGGATDRSNLGALCRRHHQLKTHGGWQITASAADGSAEWRSPAGLTYRHPPPRLPARE